MKTPLKPSLDDEIYEIEQRLQRRRAEIPRVARATGRRAMHMLASPGGLAAAAVLGFLAGGGFRKKRERLPERREQERRKEGEKKKGIAIGSLLMSGAIALIRAQYGSPFGMAQALLEKMQSRKAPPSPPDDRLGAWSDARASRRVAG